LEVLGEEQGCLPVVAGGDPAALFDAPDGVARIGTGAGLFHPLTGYSLPMAAQVAAMLANQPDLSGRALAAATQDFARRHWRKGAYYRLLARMAFGAARPEQRYRVFERFYTLSPRLIERFYAGRSTWLDRLRILAGKPPVSVLAAIRCLLGGGIPLAQLDDLGANPHPLSKVENEAL
jgi:lycopene beta-cyclase